MATSRKTATKAKTPVKGKPTTAARAAAPTVAAKPSAAKAAPKKQAQGGGKASHGTHYPDKAGSIPAPATKPDVDVFIAEYIVDRNGTRAAIAAGYAPKSAAVQASRLLTTDKVRRAVNTHREEVIAKVQQDTGITIERTLKEIARIGFFDPRRMFDAQGNPKSIHELDDDTAAVVAGLDVVEEWEGSGPERRLIGHVKKWKLADKKGALDMLMKHLGGYEVDNKQKTDALGDLLSSIGRSALPVVKDPAP
jgi:phage terminase small subunit